MSQFVYGSSVVLMSVYPNAYFYLHNYSFGWIRAPKHCRPYLGPGLNPQLYMGVSASNPPKARRDRMATQ